MTVQLVLVTEENGKRTEVAWGDISKREREAIAADLTDRFMAAAGYERERE